MNNRQIAVLNQAIEKLCAAREHCRFIDAGPALRDSDDGLSRRFHVGDGVHLNASGYRIWGAALRQALSGQTRDRLEDEGPA
jgi:lysophospholipase L1-like esterase